MSDQNTALVQSKVSVNLDDVVSVRVAEVELKLDSLLQEQKVVVEKAREKLDKAKVAVPPAVQLDVKADFKTRWTEVNAALKKAGAKCFAVLVSGGGLVNKTTLSYGVDFGTKETLVNYGGRHCATIEIPAVKAKDAIEDQESAEIGFKAENAKLLKLYEAKNRVPSVERAARATVATQRLEQTDDGREILKRMHAQDASTLLLLPANTI